MGLAADLAAILGAGVYAQQSNEWSISLDRSRGNLGYVSGLLGDRGWEMFTVETRMQPGAMMQSQLQTNWYFRRPTPDSQMGAGMGASSASAQMQSGTPALGGGSMAPAMSTTPAM